VLRECHRYNAIFSVTQAVRMNVTSLRGFLQLGEAQFKTASPAACDPVFFPTVTGIGQDRERPRQKLELSRIITTGSSLQGGRRGRHGISRPVFQAVRAKAC